MTTRQIYSLLAVLSLVGLAWLVAGIAGSLVFIFGVWFGQIDLSWIPDEPGDLAEPIPAEVE